MAKIEIKFKHSLEMKKKVKKKQKNKQNLFF